MNPKVDFYFEKAGKWQEAVDKLRVIILDCQLNEELKWGHPCYTYGRGNIVLIQDFRDYCALLFPKGALLKDTGGILVRMTENVQASRQIRFKDVREIFDMEPVIRAYIFEAVEVEKAGLKVEFKKTEEFPVPEELQIKFRELPALKEAFESLTPGRQRGYLLYFSQAKQSGTRESRIDKFIPHILSGKGLNDR